jgi:hypothetical protein
MILWVGWLVIIIVVVLLSILLYAGVFWVLGSDSYFHFNLSPKSVSSKFMWGLKHFGRL